jgi:hypothetical protein
MKIWPGKQFQGLGGKEMKIMICSLSFLYKKSVEKPLRCVKQLEMSLLNIFQLTAAYHGKINMHDNS